MARIYKTNWIKIDSWTNCFVLAKPNNVC